MINIAKSVLSLASMTEDLQSLVAMAEKVNGLERYENECMTRIKSMQDEAEKWNVEAYRAKQEAETIGQQAVNLLAAAKRERDEMLKVAKSEVKEIRDTAAGVLHTAKDQALALMAEAKEQSDKIKEEAASAVAERDAAADQLDQIRSAIKNIAGA